MTDLAKQIHAGGGSFLSDFKNLFSVFKTRRTMVAYGFLFTVIACTVFIAFSPSSNSSSPWFNNIFSSSSSSTTSSTSYGSQLSSFFSSFFPKSSVPMLDNNPNITRSLNTTSELQKQGPPSNQTDVKQQPVLNQTVNGSSTTSGVKNETSSMNKTVTEQSRVDNYTSSLSKQTNSNSSSTSITSGNNKDEKLKNNKVGNFSSLMHCDIFDGNWVKDDSYPLYSPGSCHLIDEQFNCFINGRPDRDFQKYRWQPKDCNIPRLNGKDMLELLRGKRLAFVGDSLNRNMWESLICILRNSVSDKSKVFEGSGRREFRTEHSYLFVFKDYNCTVEFFRSPFLVQEWELPETDGSKKETLRLDLVESSSSKYKDADYIVFNTGHWWTHEKTSKGKDYYQEGSHVYEDLNVVEAFRKALTTWARWVDANINPTKSLVLFRGYSASHFRGGQWNSGGQCNDETEPIKNNTYLSKYPPKMRVLEKVLKNMKTPVAYLNITRMTDFRKDAHPSVYRKQNLSAEERKSPLRFQDCSHWCLPGVPDSWNELLYARLLIKHQEQQQKQKQHR